VPPHFFFGQFSVAIRILFAAAGPSLTRQRHSMQRPSTWRSHAAQIGKIRDTSSFDRSGNPAAAHLASAAP
jgi:hypothetical protein